MSGNVRLYFLRSCYSRASDQLTKIPLTNQALETLFPHHLGHYIGLDVHDTPGQSRKEPLLAGQCVTVEP